MKNFVIFRYSKKASGLPGFGDSAENGLQQLVQTCPGAQQLIAQGLKKDVPPARAIMGMLETHFMVLKRHDDASMRDHFMMHLRLTNDEGDAKFKTKWNMMDSVPIDGKMNYYPSHGHVMSSILVNEARDSAQYLFHRFQKINNTIRFYSTTLVRFYTRNHCRAVDALCVVSSEEWEQPRFFELAVSIYINAFLSHTCSTPGKNTTQALLTARTVHIHTRMHVREMFRMACSMSQSWNDNTPYFSLSRVRALSPLSLSLAQSQYNFAEGLDRTLYTDDGA